MSQRSETVYADLSPDVDRRGRLVPFARRRDGVPCGDDACCYRYVCTPLYRTADACRRVVGRWAPHDGALLRIFVTLHFRHARVEDCTDSPTIDERALRSNEPAAIAELRRLRDEGADVLYVRGEHARSVGVIFATAIGSTVIVSEEAPHILADGGWTPVPAVPPSRQELGRPPRSVAGLVAWQLLVVLVVGATITGWASVAADVSGQAVAVPIWLVVVMSLPIAIFASARLLVVLRRWQRVQRAALISQARMDKLEAGMRQELEFWREAAHADDAADREDDEARCSCSSEHQHRTAPA